jgi:hypothetical protein
MGIILAFAPFIVFAVLDRLAGAIPGLLAGALVSAALLAWDWLRTQRPPKILEVGTFLLFGGMAAYALLGGPEWSVIGVRLRVDAGLLLIVLISMALRSPFTLQYARDRVDRSLWSSPRFLKTNYAITGAWALAFLVMVLADLVMLYLPDVPLRVGILITVAALVGAIKFTSWYPSRPLGTS